MVRQGRVAGGESQWIKAVSLWPHGNIDASLETGNRRCWVVAVVRQKGIGPVVLDARRFKLISHNQKRMKNTMPDPWPMPCEVDWLGATQPISPVNDSGGNKLFCAPVIRW